MGYMDRTTAESRGVVTATLDALPMPGWLCDRRGQILHANDRWTSYLGGESHLRRHWLTDRTIHAHDVADVRRTWHRGLTSGREFDVNARLRRFDGTWRWHVLRGVPIGPTEDPAAGWLGTWTDVHEALADVEELRRRERMLAALGEASLDAKILVSPDRRLIWANRRAYDLWGVSRVDYPPGTDMRAAAEELGERVRDPERNSAVLNLMYDDPDRVVRDELEMADGRVMERYSTPVVDSDGTLLGRMNTYRDVTVSRQEMAALHERAKATLVLSYVADAVILVDSSGIVHFWNSAAELLTGIRAKDALDRRLADLLVDWALALEIIPVLDSVDERRTAATIPLELSGGREVWVSAVGVRFEDGVVFALRDVTDDQRLDRMRSDIVATVSHELRTPLTSIYGMAITLQDEGPRLDDLTRRRLLTTIVEQSARLGSLLDDILVANGLETGTVTMRPARVDVGELVQSAVGIVSASLPMDLPIGVVVDPDVPPVAADGARAEQALVNLLENAVKYSPDGGDIEVHARVVSHGEVGIDVVDHGLGIPAEELENVFVKFHRLDPTMTLGVAGTGLGLYIARELARRMGGDVQVTSIEGAGSTFTLVLPKA